MIDFLNKAPFMPITQAGDIIVSRHRETLDLVLVFQTPVGPLSQTMSDEVAIDLAVKMIREVGRRGERTAQVMRNLHGALEAQKERDDEQAIQDADVPVGADGGNGVCAAATGNGASDPRQRGPEGRRDLSPCSPRSLGLPGTESRGHSPK